MKGSTMNLIWKLNFITILMLWLLASSTVVLASPLNKLLDYASQDGAMVSHNGPAIMQDQQGGYLTGGSMLIRGPKPMTLEPFNVQTPKFRFDACTGSADFRFGGLSYISSDEFTRFFKNMTTAAGSYAVKMLIKTACPQCEDIMSYLETVARSINEFSMDQCGSAQAIAQGAFSMISNGNKQKCLMQANVGREARDMAEAVDKCHSNADQFGDNRGASNELESLLGDQFNLVWKALSRSGSIESVQFKELIMSVSGSIIGQKVDGSMSYKNLPSLVDGDNMVEKYIGNKNQGANVKLYVCDEGTKCLNPTAQLKNIPQKDTLYGRVEKILDGLIDKVTKNPRGATITDEEYALTEFSTIPLVPLIQQELARSGDAGNIFLRNGEFLDAICYDIMTGFLEGLIHKSIKEVKALEFAQVDNTVIEGFYKDARYSLQYLSNMKITAYKRLQIILQTKEKLMGQEKEFESLFSRISMQEY
jgi:hypothetical protein